MPGSPSAHGPIERPAIATTTASLIDRIPSPPLNLTQRPSFSSSSSDEPIVLDHHHRPSLTITDNATAGPSRRTAYIASTPRSRVSSGAGNAPVRLNGGTAQPISEDDDEPIFVGSISSSSTALGHLAKKYTFKPSPTPTRIVNLSSKRSSRSVTPIPKTAGAGAGPAANPSRKGLSARYGGSRSGSGSSGEIVILDETSSSLVTKAKVYDRRKNDDGIEFCQSAETASVVDECTKKPAKGRLKSTLKEKGKGKGRMKSERGEGVVDISHLPDDVPPFPRRPKSESKSASTDSAPPLAPLPLLPDLALEPAPVPSWLGKTAVLLQLPACAVCKVRFKKSDSGAARWRHMSTCRPPLFRPPNPPPDLQSLIHEALHALSAPSEPTSLFDLHVRLSDTDPLGAGATASGSRDDSPIKGATGKKKLGITGLKSYTNVRASFERGDKWHEDVRQRVRDFIGPSSPVRGDSASPEPHTEPRLGSTSPSRSVLDSQGGYELKSDQGYPTKDDGSERSEDEMPSTQPLGESSLAQLYGKTGYETPSPSGTPSRSPVTPDSPISISISLSSTEEIPPPSSQKRSISFRQDDSAGRGIRNDPFDSGETRESMLVSPQAGRLSSTDPSRPDGAAENQSLPAKNGDEAFERENDVFETPDLITSRPPVSEPKETSSVGTHDVVEIPDSPSPEKESTPRHRHGDEQHLTPSSVTPTAARATGVSRLRAEDKAGSVTPTAPADRIVYTLPSSSPESDLEAADAWGDEAVLTWSALDEAREDVSRHKERDEEVWSVDSSDAVSSVPPSEAGLGGEDLDQDEDEDEGDWGRDAYLTWNAQVYENNDDDDEEGGEEDGGIVTMDGESEDDDVRFVHHGEDGEDGEDEEEDEVAEAVAESVTQLVARGMPDYSRWDLKKLQKLVVSYGFRTSNDHKSLEKVAVDCWKAIHPPPVSIPATVRSSPKAAKSKRSNVPRKTVDLQIDLDRSRDSSISSADIPLAKVRGSSLAKPRKAQSKARASDGGAEAIDSDDEVMVMDDDAIHIHMDGAVKKGKSKGKGKEKEKEPSQSVLTKDPVDMDQKFYDMIMGDRELWSRILRYEPINFDEMISKSIAAGIDKLSRSWKKELKRYLDLQSVTYFTEDPTGGQRRRH
ncbi:hypothetical protein I316_00698 [Kwoniella heveanensis BCC8398]|uniref:Structure-specific endonuclease subunit SLX4 n=1 Tax=Kwoniella heveanensis BCC8398 TaxID=1296120 RepID=A0A1B9H2S5_9TREE|nr:hypothetical protein I316_00698 [Kwoniella heveanensis BCC8398]